MSAEQRRLLGEARATLGRHDANDPLVRLRLNRVDDAEQDLAGTERFLARFAGLVCQRDPELAEACTDATLGAFAADAESALQDAQLLDDVREGFEEGLPPEHQDLNEASRAMRALGARRMYDAPLVSMLSQCGLAALGVPDDHGKR